MSPVAIIDFWFGPPGSIEYGKNRAIWFKKDPAFDADLRKRFLEIHADAAAGRLTEWEATAESSLALIILLDQFSRNMFRGEPGAFACDGEALRLAKHMIHSRQEHAFLPVMRSFVYLPLEHSENLRDQDESVRLFGILSREPGMGDLLVWAEKHRDVIRRFGRFPHRNVILGRQSTPTEIDFLAQPGSTF